MFMPSIKTKRNVLLSFTIISLICLVAVLFTGFSREEDRKVYAAQDFRSGENFTYYAGNEFDYKGLTFEYKITSSDETYFNMCVLSGDWANYYGYFKFNSAGAVDNYDGVTVSQGSDGYISVEIDFISVTKAYLTPPEKTKVFFIRGDYSTADGLLRKISFEKREKTEDDQEIPEYGKKYYSGTNNSIYAPASKLYDKVVFEYKVAKVGATDRFALCLLEQKTTNFFGYYFFSSSGLTSTNKSGVTVNRLDDGFMRVVMFIPLLTRTNETDSRAFVPTDITRIYMRDIYMNDDVYIRNVVFIEKSGFSMGKGAAVRTAEPYGIKFRANIPQSVYDKNALYGMAIFPYDYIGRYALKGDYVSELMEKGVEFKNAYLKIKTDDNLDYYIESYLINIPEANITIEYVGIAYKLKNGIYTYAENVEECRRSVKEVSRKAVGNIETFIDYTEDEQSFLANTSGSSALLTDSVVSVNSFDSLGNFRKDEPVTANKTLTLSAAQGESEFGQIILTANNADICGESYSIAVSDLIHSDGETVLSKRSFDVFNGHYINVADNWVYYGQLGYESALYTGYYVDAIVPFSAASKKEETVFDNANGNNQSVFIRFNVPPKQKAGVYTGTFKIYVLGVGYKTVPVRFEVYDFVLPEENALKSIYGIDNYRLANLFGSSNLMNSEEYEELYEFIKEYGINCMYNPHYYSDGETTIDDYIETLVKAYEDVRVTAVKIDVAVKPITYTYKKSRFYSEKTYTDLDVVIEDDYLLSNGNHRYGTKTTLKKIAEYCVSNDINLFEKLYFHVGDEPSEPEHCIRFVLSYNACRRGIDYVLNDAGIDWTGHEDIKASLQNLPIFVDSYAGKQVKDYTGSKVYGQCAGNQLIDNVYSQSAFYQSDDYNSEKPITITYKYIDDYVSSYDDVYGKVKDSKTVAILNDSDPNTHVWWYGCVVPLNPYQSYFVNANHVITRSNFWAQYYYGVEGILYYLVNGWVNEEYDISTGDSTHVVLTEDEIWNGESRWADGYGDGTLVYPNVTRYDADFKFCATYRLIATKEGVDDYNYIVYAQSLIDAMAASSKKNEMQAALDNVVGGMLNASAERAVVNSSAEKVRSARAQLVEIIIELI